MAQNNYEIVLKNRPSCRIASFDVGIKNMAICVFDISGEDKKIVYWDVLNLIKNETHQETHPCTCHLIARKKGEPIRDCGKNAKYMKNGNYFCEKHAKMSEFIIPKREFSSPVLKKSKIDHLMNISKQYLIDVGNIKTKKDILEKLTAFFEKRCLEIIQSTKVKSANDIDLVSIGRNMKIAMDNIPLSIDSISHVIIENQISPIANRMKTIQGMLAQYFIMEGSPELKIEFVSSSNKLRGLERDTNDEGYKQRKKDGIYHCEKFLEHTSSFSEYVGWLEGHKKSDDLADCFLQGVWYIKKPTV
jgi:hypothetical protein